MSRDYHVEFEAPAWKAIMALAPRFPEHIFTAIEGLETNAQPIGVKKLRGVDDLYRVRVGDYRINYSIEDERLRVIVVAMGHRSKVYR